MKHFVIFSIGLLLTACAPTDTTPTEEVAGSSAASSVAKLQGTSVAYLGDTEGYLSLPEGEGPFPGIVLIHEWWGLNDQIRGMADRFADAGYVALAVDLYDGRSAAAPEDARTYASEVRENTDVAMQNLTAATDYLKGLSVVDSDRLASAGWCFGGQWSYEMAKNNMGLDASVMYYGRFSAEDDLEQMTALIQGHFGEEDQGIPVDDVKAFRAKLNTLNGDHEVYIYENAGHAFMNEDNDAYHEASAKQAWDRTMRFLEEVL